MVTHLSWDEQCLPTKITRIVDGFIHEQVIMMKHLDNIALSHLVNLPEHSAHELQSLNEHFLANGDLS